MLPKEEEIVIGIIGLGYVGLPLAIEFGVRYPTTGYDISPLRIEELKRGMDITREVSKDDFARARQLVFSDQPIDLKGCNVYIVTVPTPVDESKQPDLSHLVSASALVGGVLIPGDVVVYESTVFPGATEECCVPILEHNSSLKFNTDFYVGYSPERINPGDKERGLTSIVKVTSGSTAESAEFVDRLYGSIVSAGTHKASSIKVAEAAKVIENTQRDINIALINELAILFNRLGVETDEVLAAAGTKWNFLPFKPGLVGGHCIGVDPYYLTHKAQAVGYYPEVILAGRRINDNMGRYVVDQVVRLMTESRIHVVDSKILVVGLTFKANCPDLRNTRVIDIIDGLGKYHAEIDVYDPVADKELALKEYDIDLVEAPKQGCYDALVIAVDHAEIKSVSISELKSWCKREHVIYDVKSIFPSEVVSGRL